MGDLGALKATSSGREQPADASFSELVRTFARIGMLSFGGPAGQIALMHRELVEERSWIGEDDFLHALNFCHLLPGPEAQQLATWIGWRLHGWRGGLVAGLLFVIPGAAVILALSLLYGFAAQLAWLQTVFLGVKAAVLVIVVQALLRIAGRALDTRLKQVLAIGAFAALFLFALPFPFVVLGAGAIGMAAASIKPDWLALKQTADTQSHRPRPWATTVKAVVICGALWAAPMVLIALTLGQHHVLWDIGAFRSPEPFSPVVAGLLGAMLTIWVTFAPCFMWIFALAPWIDRLGNAVRLKGGLAAVTAAVVGVIANLPVWFALHVLFGEVGKFELGPVSFLMPDFSTMDQLAISLVLFAYLLAFTLKFPVVRLIAACALCGLAFSLTS